MAKKISVLVVKDTGESNLSFRLPAWFFKFFIFLIGLFFVALVAFVFYYGKISTQFIYINNILEENQTLTEKVKKVEMLYGEIRKIRAFEKKIKILAMNYVEEDPDTDPSFSFSSQGDGPYFEKEIDEFVKNIKLQRNLNYINLKDSLQRRKELLKSVPNTLPVDGWISRRYNTSSLEPAFKNHLGVDIAAAFNSPVRSSGPGLVTFAGWRRGFGNVVEVDHGFGFVSRYGHCSRILKKKGDIVQRSQTIALVGNSGRSSGPHVHYEVLKDGKLVDPLIFVLK